MRKVNSMSAANVQTVKCKVRFWSMEFVVRQVNSMSMENAQTVLKEQSTLMEFVVLKANLT